MHAIYFFKLEYKYKYCIAWMVRSSYRPLLLCLACSLILTSSVYVLSLSTLSDCQQTKGIKNEEKYLHRGSMNINCCIQVHIYSTFLSKHIFIQTVSNWRCDSMCVNCESVTDAHICQKNCSLKSNSNASKYTDLVNSTNAFPYHNFLHCTHCTTCTTQPLQWILHFHLNSWRDCHIQK